MKLVKLISYVFLILVLVGTLAIGSENGGLVDLNLLVVKVQMPVAFVIYIAFVSGLLLAGISSLLKKFLKKSNA